MSTFDNEAGGPKPLSEQQHSGPIVRGPGTIPAKPWPLPGAKLIAAPLPEWGTVVSMVEHNGSVYVACQYRFLKLVDGVLETVMIVAVDLSGDETF